MIILAIDKEQYQADMARVHSKLGEHEKWLEGLTESQENLEKDQRELRSIVEGRDQLVHKALTTMPKWGSVMLGGLGILVSILTLIVAIVTITK